MPVQVIDTDEIIVVPPPVKFRIAHFLQKKELGHNDLIPKQDFSRYLNLAWLLARQNYHPGITMTIWTKLIKKDIKEQLSAGS